MAQERVSPDAPARATELATWVDRAQAGDRSAFAALHARFAPMIHAVLLARVAAQEVEDLHQEVFFSAWRGLGSLRRADHVGAWLATIARNAAARHHARARPRPESLVAEPLDARAEAGSDGAEILASLRGLPEAYRETLALRLVQGCSGPEIAELTGLTPGSVRVNLSRGMKLLRTALGREGWS